MTQNPMVSPPAQPRRMCSANVAEAMKPGDAEIEADCSPCQRWARRCLLGRERDLADELRAHYRARLAATPPVGNPGDSSGGGPSQVIAALTAIHVILSRWPSACANCPAPVLLLRPGNVARCQVLRALLPDAA